MEGRGRASNRSPEQSEERPPWRAPSRTPGIPEIPELIYNLRSHKRTPMADNQNERTDEEYMQDLNFTSDEDGNLENSTDGILVNPGPDKSGPDSDAEYAHTNISQESSDRDTDVGPSSHPSWTRYSPSTSVELPGPSRMVTRSQSGSSTSLEQIDSSSEIPDVTEMIQSISLRVSDIIVRNRVGNKAIQNDADDGISHLSGDSLAPQQPAQKAECPHCEKALLINPKQYRPHACTKFVRADTLLEGNFVLLNGYKCRITGLTPYTKKNVLHIVVKGFHLFPPYGPEEKDYVYHFNVGKIFLKYEIVLLKKIENNMAILGTGTPLKLRESDYHNKIKHAFWKSKEDVSVVIMSHHYDRDLLCLNDGEETNASESSGDL